MEHTFGLADFLMLTPFIIALWGLVGFGAYFAVSLVLEHFKDTWRD